MQTMRKTFLGRRLRGQDLHDRGPLGILGMGTSRLGYVAVWIIRAPAAHTNTLSVVYRIDDSTAARLMAGYAVFVRLP